MNWDFLFWILIINDNFFNLCIIFWIGEKL